MLQLKCHCATQMPFEMSLAFAQHFAFAFAQCILAFQVAVSGDPERAGGEVQLGIETRISGFRFRFGPTPSTESRISGFRFPVSGVPPRSVGNPVSGLDLLKPTLRITSRSSFETIHTRS